MAIAVRHIARVSCFVALAAAFGCGRGAAPADARAARTDQAVRAKYGRPLAELPLRRMGAITPNNQNICEEFERAFNLWHAHQYGERVKIDWRDVGGGGTAILSYLRNVYSRSDTAELDIVWGGGDDSFRRMAAEGILRPMRMSDELKAAIPARWGGVAMYDANGLWCGSTLSGFGFLYNRKLVEWAKIPAPRQWQDLARPECFGQILLADPTQSSAAAMSYEMIVQSAPSWPEGWARLLAVLGNARRFADSAGAAANGPLLGEAPIATCIDFYGIMRVSEAPEAMVYVSPRGQTIFTPDPIGILKNPPSAELAQRFIDFVLSDGGQGLWALPAGAEGGPARSSLGRQPIRRDTCERYAGKGSLWTVNPYVSGGEMKADMSILPVRMGVIKQLVRAAAVDNVTHLQAARKRLIATNFEPQRLAEFNCLPADIGTTEGLKQVSKQLRDPTQAERIVTGWQQFFRAKYRKVAE